MHRRRNTSAFDDCDLVPNVLAGVEQIDMSTTVLGMKLMGDRPVADLGRDNLRYRVPPTGAA